MNQVQPRQTEYEKYKKDKDPVFDGKGKQLISKAGKLDDGLCHLSEDGFCSAAKEQGREFYCASHWWRSCTVYMNNRDVKI